MTGLARASVLARAAGLAIALVVWAAPRLAGADGPGSTATPFVVESIAMRFAHFDQDGAGFQSRAGPAGGPGSERLRVEQPQLEVVAKQGDRLTHRVWVPVDIVSAASPDAIDAVSTASRDNEAAGVDWTATYAVHRKDTVSLRNGFHAEEPFRSWNVGIGGSTSIADDNATLSATLDQTFDWFERYTLAGELDGGEGRSTTDLDVGFTQLLSTTTIAHVDYDVSFQRGELGNTWSTVPLAADTPSGSPSPALLPESLPERRLRHALSGRVAQWLPWNGAVHAAYRLYLDDWGVTAQTLELELHQRLSRFSRLLLRYRAHGQDGVAFFTTRAPAGRSPRTADSDLGPLASRSIGVRGLFELPDATLPRVRFDLGVERYVRTNEPGPTGRPVRDLTVTVYSCGLALYL